MIALDDLIAAGGHLYGPPHTTSFADFSYDSRLARPGELFLALRTPRADGHDYIPATALLVECVVRDVHGLLGCRI